MRYLIPLDRKGEKGKIGKITDLYISNHLASMSKGLLVSSVEAKSGKSAMIVAMASIFRKEGYKVGFFKPFGTSPEYLGGRIVDGDALNTARLIGVAIRPRTSARLSLRFPTLSL
jgi:hypothetical protein